MWVAQSEDQEITSLSVHPTRRHLCLAGTSWGTAVLWDLRFTRGPLMYTLPDGAAGDVAQLTSEVRHINTSAPHFSFMGLGEG
jgi:hypothetical protein